MTAAERGTRPLRILFVTAYFRPHRGGIERFVEILAGGLSGRGHEVAVVCCATEPGSPRRETADGYRVERVRATNAFERRLQIPYPLPEVVTLARTLARELARADVVHVADAVYVSSATALALARRARRPAVLTQHVGFAPTRSAALDGVQHGLLRAVAPLARSARVVTAYNAAVLDWAARLWSLRDARLLPIGAPEAPAERVPRSRFGLPEDRFLVLFVGRDVPRKGLDLLLAAREPSFDVVAVTDPGRPAQDGVHYLEPMAPERLAELYTCVDALVLPSVGDTMPFVIQEAMTAGVPVATPLEPGYERYFGEDDVLVVERTPDSIRARLSELAQRPELRERLARRGLAVAARHYGRDRFLDEYESLYLEVAASGST